MRTLEQFRLAAVQQSLSDRISVRYADFKPDEEWRWPTEPYGFHEVAWLPRKCRNGRWRWLCWVEHHRDGSYTKGRGG